MKKISILSPCYNEEENVEELYKQVKAQFDLLPQYSYEHIFIDNASTDNTVAILRQLAAKDKNVKLILNAKNAGHIRSPYHGLMQAHGDAVITMASDLQNPPELIPDFIKKWEEGHQIVIGIKAKSKENPIVFLAPQAILRRNCTLFRHRTHFQFHGFWLIRPIFHRNITSH